MVTTAPGFIGPPTALVGPNWGGKLDHGGFINDSPGRRRQTVEKEALDGGRESYVRAIRTSHIEERLSLSIPGRLHRESNQGLNLPTTPVGHIISPLFETLPLPAREQEKDFTEMLTALMRQQAGWHLGFK